MAWSGSLDELISALEAGIAEATRRGFDGRDAVIVLLNQGHVQGSLRELQDERHAVRASDIKSVLLRWYGGQDSELDVALVVSAGPGHCAADVSCIDGVAADAICAVMERELEFGRRPDPEYGSDIVFIEHGSDRVAATKTRSLARASPSPTPADVSPPMVAGPKQPRGLLAWLEARSVLVQIAIAFAALLVGIAAIIVPIALAH